MIINETSHSTKVKQLNVQTFKNDYGLANFVNDHKLTKDDIQTILFKGDKYAFRYTLFYWE